MVHPVVRALRRVLTPLIGAALGLAWLGLSSAPVQAQAGTVSGTVVDSKTGRPLADARVAVEGNEQSAQRTGVRGDFRLTGLSGTTVRLRVTRIGYQAVTAESPVGGAPIEIKLVEMVVKLDELVVTGTPGEAQKRTLGNVIGNVDVAGTALVAGPPSKIQNLLSVNVPGVRIDRSSGAIGAGGRTRIRGSGSLSLSNEPLVYVDGVRVDNRAATPSYAFVGYDTPSRVNDLNPEEIESIEVLKGPSAATIYGTEASNGVIQIITKRGRAGRPTFDVHADAGANWIMNPDGRYPSNYYYSQVDQEVKEFDVLKFNKDKLQQFPDSTIFRSPFSMGTPFSGGASLSGGSDQLRYYFNADFARDEGAVHYNWQNKMNGRANLTYSTADDKFKVDFSLGAVRMKTRGASGVQPMTTSVLWACNFPGCEPNPNSPNNTGFNDAGHGYQFYRPEDYDGVQAFDNIDRTTFSVQLSHRPLSWLRHRLVIGPDFVNNKSSRVVERYATSRRPFFTASDGLKQTLHIRSQFMTIDYGASADASLFGGNLVATTAAGVQYYYKHFDQVQGQGFIFSIPGPSDIDGGSQISATETFTENKNLGVYAQEQLAWKNRLFLTGAFRADDNSAFGSNFNAAYYPKVSVSWVASEEPFLANSSFLSQLKFRGAWGRAGLQPDVFFALQLYTPVIGNAGQGAVTPANYGNPDLKPEVGEETEIGFDAGLFNQRLGIEFTYYRKDIKDAILSLPLRPSRGFPGSQFLNIGKTRNKGIELAIDGTPINGRNFGIDLRATLATNDSKILDMGGTPPAFTGSSFLQQYNLEGFAPSAFFYKRVVSSTIQTVPVSGVPLPIGFSPMCEDGDVKATVGAIRLAEGNGGVVPCSQAPLLYEGRPTPSWNGSFSATFRIGQRLRILGLVDYLGGSTAVVGDVAGIHSFFFSSKALLEGSSDVLAGYIGLQLVSGDPNNGIGPTGLIKSGFAKLRTISATYDLPPGLNRLVGAARGSITVAGENLATLWREQVGVFGVDWIDPEVSPNLGGTGNQGYIQESWPQLARIRTTFRFTF
jgi:TonB-linked SusC/RagA family outer membrane protein